MWEDLVNYTVIVRNEGNTNLVNIAVTDSLPTYLEYIRGTSTINGHKSEPKIEQDSLIWIISSLAPGEEAIIKFSCRMLEYSRGGIIINPVNVRGFETYARSLIYAPISLLLLIPLFVLTTRRRPVVVDFEYLKTLFKATDFFLPFLFGKIIISKSTFEKATRDKKISNIVEELVSRGLIQVHELSQEARELSEEITSTYQVEKEEGDAIALSLQCEAEKALLGRIKTREAAISLGIRALGCGGSIFYLIEKGLITKEEGRVLLDFLVSEGYLTSSEDISLGGV